MTKQNPAPPPLPDKIRARVLAVSRANGWGVAGFAAACVLVAALRGHWAEAGWALLATGAGVLELWGQGRVRRGHAAGLAAMIGSQLLLLAVIWVYAWLRWIHFDPDVYWNQFPRFAQVLLEQRMAAEGLDPVLDRPLLMTVTNFLVCVVLALVSLVYQGGLAAWYAIKARAVRTALA